MRALGEPDALPSGDLGLLRALDLQTARELERRAEVWRPWRSYAAMYLWNKLSESGIRQSEIVARQVKMGTLERPSFPLGG